MRRRTYLAGTVSALAAISGCTANGLTTADDSDMKKVTNVSASGLEATDVAIDPSVERAEITPDHTAEILFTIVWNGQERQNLVFGNSIPYTSPKKSTKPHGLLLVDEDHEYERQDDETWVPKTEDPDNLSTGNIELKGARLEPGGSVSHAWEVWADPGEVSRIESGTYTFDDSISVGQSERIDWSLTVEIEEQ